MKRRWRHRRAKLSSAKRLAEPGSPPGLVLSNPLAQPTEVDGIGFGADRAKEIAYTGPDCIRAAMAEFPVLWLRVRGLKDTNRLRELSDFFALHPLTLEDIVNVHQRPKVDEFAKYLFVVARLPTEWSDPASDPTPGTEQMSLILGDGFLLSFHERPVPTVEVVRRRVLESAGKIRSGGPDRLLYALLDAGMDAYFPVLEDLGQTIDLLEDSIVVRPNRHTIARVHDVKRHLIALRRAVWPLREVFNSLIRNPTELISAETRVYLRDCEDHAFQLVELIETYRELGSDMTDLYVSVTSHRLNEVMKVLTVIATIFIPLTFIVGIYGMNFDYMPELHWRYGYPMCLTMMGGLAIGLLVYFRRRGWIGEGETDSSAHPPNDC